MYDLILFDLDGTLTEPKEGITKCVQYALKHFGIEVEDLEVLKPFIGPPLVDGFMEFYKMSKEEALKAVEIYREIFAVKGLYENAVYDGVFEMLEELKKNKKTIALATSKPHIYAKEILKYFHMEKYFDIVVGAELDGTRNDKSEIIAEVLKGCENHTSPIMVGDRKHDVIGAHKNNIPCIGVAFGYAAEGELEKFGAEVIVNDIKELTVELLKCL